jgi:hypothetical protein
MAKKLFNCSTWTKDKKSTISIKSISFANAYLKDSLNHLECGKISKIEVDYSSEK